jgi:hypothetical protein
MTVHTVKHVFDGARHRCGYASLHNELVISISVLFVITCKEGCVLEMSQNPGGGGI